MKYIYQCPVCKKYLMEDGTWERPTAKEFAMMLFLSDKFELKEMLCPTCDTERRW